MDDLETQLGAILSDPQMMQKISSLAQNLGGGQSQENNAQQNLGNLDPQLLARLSGLAGQSGIDPNQRSLLSALSPYLSHGRISKLERAMRAAKMARLASGLLGQSDLLGR